MTPDSLEDYRHRIIVVYSPDGGNGKSEIAANVAFSMAKHGLRTWVFDANLFAPTQDIIFPSPAANVTFSEFLTNPGQKEIPLYNISDVVGCGNPGRMFLTPSGSRSPEVRFLLRERMNGGNDLYSGIPDALFRGMQTEDIDLLIIDTHPGFEEMNEVWLGLTEYLIIISRMNDIDLENLRALLRDGEVADIDKKLIVFNNVQLGENRQALQAMDNTWVAGQFFDASRLDELEAELSEDVGKSGSPDGSNTMSATGSVTGSVMGTVTIYDEPFFVLGKTSYVRGRHRAGRTLHAERAGGSVFGEC